jgi:hypothetical protein
MTDIESGTSEAGALLDDLYPLLLVPLTLSVLRFDNLQSVISHRGGYVGLRFPLPVPVGDLWLFVSPPGSAGAVGPSVSAQASGAGLFVALLFGFLVSVGIESVLTAGYIGSIQQYRREHTYDFLSNVQRYWQSYLVLLALPFAVVALSVPIVRAVPGFLLFVALGLLVALYLFWGAWFLVPVADVGAVEALRRSYRLAVSEDAYMHWTLLHLLIAAPLSLLLTTLAVAGGVLGVTISLAVALPVGFGLTVVSLRVIDGVAGPESPASDSHSTAEFDSTAG